MNKQIKDIEKIKNTIISNNKSLIISVNNKINYPEIGYAPYIFLKKDWSQILNHDRVLGPPPKF